MFLRTLFVWAMGLPVTLLLFAVVLLSLIVDRSGSLVHSIGAFWSRVILRLSGVRVNLAGAGNIPEGRPVIFLSNHQGAFDIPALQAFLPVQFRWVAKKSLFRIPVIGWSMTLAGYIPIEREHAHEAMRSIESAAGRIQSGTSVLVFPEGTRSSTGELLPFKKGGFALAKKSGVQVVPVAITGTKDIMKKGSLSIRPSSVRITIGKPIDPSGMEEPELRALTRRAIEEMLK